MKSIFLGLGLLFCSGLLFAQSKVNLTILNADKKEGRVYISLFNSESSYNKRQVFRSFTAIPQSDSTIIKIDLPVGDYLFSAYQDSNHNGKLDSNLIGIPKEKFGFSNYDGKSAPGRFNKHKVLINEKTRKITVQLYKI